MIHCVSPAGVARYRRYRAAAYYYQLSSEMLHPDSEYNSPNASIEVVAGAIEYSARQLQQAFIQGLVDQSTPYFLVQRRTIQVSVERAVAFRKELVELARKFVGMDEPNGELTLELAMVLFPHATAPADRQQEPSGGIGGSAATNGWL